MAPSPLRPAAASSGSPNCPREFPPLPVGDATLQVTKSRPGDFDAKDFRGVCDRKVAQPRGHRRAPGGDRVLGLKRALESPHLCLAEADEHTGPSSMWFWRSASLGHNEFVISQILGA